MRAFGEWPPGLRAVVAVAATTLFMVLVAWATLLGPDEVFTGPGPAPATTTTAETCIPLPVTTAEDGSTTVELPDDFTERNYCEGPAGFGGDGPGGAVEQAPPLWVGVLTGLLLAAAAAGGLAVLAWLAALVLREVRARRLREEERTAVGFTVPDEPARVAQQVAADAGEQETLLREGDPRNAIVAAWHHFEVQGERAGVARRASETSSEYGLRILDLAAADNGSVNRLAELYREARFSDHPVTEEHRERALVALADVRRSLGVGA
ncbi:DUF4129 domain-containing protein [Nocardioides cavernae]|uniref:DUF4129 domain-containing protein n=1 Tax=Nocardioides cavernae TaxID=1921566 RepID=A0ABR8NAZ2_9ACTN|nr:DUF4129 domain-containing protein [Nocardioides cavernae]MBD3925299.1 DUF4129 domain-containing protein [Nocardioides cavernae]MBM7514322.1 hypothetical protein [Nocardioides cavernae]